MTRYTPTTPTGDEATKLVTSAEDAILNTPDPEDPIAGVSCRGFGQAILYLDATTLTSATVKIYISPDDGVTWTESTDDEVTMADVDAVKSYDVRATTRIAARVTAINGTSVKRVLQLA